jgi:hypothetical protein
MQKIGLSMAPPGFGNAVLMNGSPAGGDVRDLALRPGFIAAGNTQLATFGVVVSMPPGAAMTRTDIAFAPASASISRSDLSFSAADQSVRTVAGDFGAGGFAAGQNVRIVSGSALNAWTGTILAVTATKLTVRVLGPGVVTEAAGAGIVIIGGFGNVLTTVAGNFLTSGFLECMRLSITGSASNNLTAEILTVSALSMTLGGVVLVTEAAGATVVLAGLPDPSAFYVGIPSSYVPVGVLLNEAGVRQNDPGKPSYILPEMPITVATRGKLRYGAIDSAFFGALPAPVSGARVVANNTTGAIGLMAAGAVVPATHTRLQAVVTVDPIGTGFTIELLSTAS